jgi:tripartite-type tricarboxylate transporter receptor subunit TctC
MRSFRNDSKHRETTRNFQWSPSRRDVLGGIGGSLLAITGAHAAQAQAAADFYRNKTFRIVVAAAPGAAYDLVARAVAASMGRHIPGRPTIIVENLYGAASLVLMNSLYNKEARDGTVIGLPLSGIVLEPRLKLLARQGGAINFNLDEMSFVGSPTQQPQILWVWHETPFHSVDDLRRSKSRMGATSFGADNYVLPTFGNALLGTSMQVVTGYSAVTDIFLAGERGELDGGTCNYSSLASKDDWMRDKKARILIQFGTERIPELPDVPTAIELAGEDIARAALRTYALKYKAAYPFVFPPGVPADRVKIIRDAFMAAMKDPQFVGDAKKLGFDVNPLTGEAITEMTREIDTAAPEVIERLKKLLS